MVQKCPKYPKLEGMGNTISTGRNKMIKGKIRKGKISASYRAGLFSKSVDHKLRVC